MNGDIIQAHALGVALDEPIAQPKPNRFARPPRREPDYLMLALHNVRLDRDSWRGAYVRQCGVSEKWRTRTLGTLGIGALCGMALAVGAFVIARAL